MGDIADRMREWCQTEIVDGRAPVVMLAFADEVEAVELELDDLGGTAMLLATKLEIADRENERLLRRVAHLREYEAERLGMQPDELRYEPAPDEHLEAAYDERTETDDHT